MTDHTDSPGRNASLDEFTNATPTTETDADSGTPNRVSTTTTTETGIPFDDDAFDDPDLHAFVQQHDDDVLRSLVTALREESDVLSTVREATNDETLQANIETVSEHYAERPSLVDAAADQIAEKLGSRPFSVTVTEPDSEYLTPMISLTVDEDTVFTKNPVLNTEIIEHATRIDGVTRSGQERVFERWRDAIGGDVIAAFKQDRHPDALGFALPSHIPATGDEPGRTPVTEIPYIGPATVEELHPTGELMSVEDLIELTEKQWAWVEFPVEARELDVQRVRGIATGIVSLAPNHATTLLGRVLGFMDRRESDGELDWVNPANTVGITGSETLFEETETAPVTEVDKGDGKVTVMSALGDSTYDTGFWALLNALAEETENDVFAGDNTPAFVRLPDTGFVITAPISPGT